MSKLDDYLNSISSGSPSTQPKPTQPVKSSGSKLDDYLASISSPVDQPVTEETPVVQPNKKDLAKKIAWLDQASNTVDEFGDSLSVYDTVMLGRLPHQGWLHLPSKTDQIMVEQALQQTDVWHLRQRPLQQLSGGERQRVLLARLLAVGSDILLMDEPLANLDPPHQADFLKWQGDLLAQGKTLVTVLHEIHFALRADHVIMLNRGKLHFQGSSQDPATHQALISLFDGRIHLEKLGSDWVALPN